ncbi:MAG: hypothetical protein LBE14_05850 [Treponema sp.]|jgi:uncharacterized membrane protein YkvI|nr:hypothetical protein [Treponema sp.]
MNEKLSLKEKFVVASGQFGGMLGAGICSGATVTVYFVAKGGYLAPVTALIALLFLFLTYYLGIEMGRVYDIHNYRELFKEIYGKAGVIMSPLTDIMMVYSLMISTAFAFSGCGSYFNQTLGLPILIGASGAAIICLIIAFKGIGFFNKVQGIMCFVMFAILLIVYITIIFGFGYDSLIEKFSLRWLPENYSTGTMALWCFYFAASYLSFLSIYLISGKKIKRKKDVLQTCGIGLILNIGAVVLPVITLLAFAPRSFSFNIPMLYIMTDILKFPPAQIVYSVLLLFAFLTTGAACLVSLNDRFERYIPKNVTNPVIRKAVVPVIVSVISLVLAPMGLLSLLSQFSPYSSIASIITIFVPVLFIAPVKIRKIKGTQFQKSQPKE